MLLDVFRLLEVRPLSHVHRKTEQGKASGVQGAAMSPLVARATRPTSPVNSNEGEITRLHPQIPLRNLFFVDSPARPPIQ